MCSGWPSLHLLPTWFLTTWLPDLGSVFFVDYQRVDYFSVGIMTRILLCWDLLPLLAAFWSVLHSWEHVLCSKIFLPIPPLFVLQLDPVSSPTNDVSQFMFREDKSLASSVIQPDWSDCPWVISIRHDSLCRGKITERQKTCTFTQLFFLFS